MKKVTILFLFAIYFQCNAQWSAKKPFDQRLFIENKGQYFLEGKFNEADILYGSREGNEHYFFTKKGLSIMTYHRVKRSEREIDAIRKKFNIKEDNKRNAEEEKEFGYKNIPEFHEVEWLGGNPNPEVVTEKRVNEMYNYGDARHPNSLNTIQAKAFKKITYKNVYPNIDVEYLFPEDKAGYKYNIILHPGANAGLIQMKYSTDEKLNLDGSNNLNIKSPFGTFIDHAPIAFTANKKEISCSFSIEKNVVSFILPNNTITETTTIDPWVVNPNNIAWNDAFDVDYDNAGNVYIDGGSYPYQIKKYDPTGALLWSFSCTNFIKYFSSDAFYGDFAVDRNSESVYTVEGYNGTGAKALKLNSIGNLVAIDTGVPNFTEMWRISFSNCTNQAVIAGGGVSSPTYHACYLDTNLTNLSLVTLNGGGTTGDDNSLLALDNYGNAYMMTTYLPNTTPSQTGLSGKLIKVPLPALLPIQYSVPTGHVPEEIISYYNNPSNGGGGFIGYSITNAFNGITTSNTNVYTYDGYALKKWAGANGALIKYKRINYPTNNDSSVFRYSGITADDCDNIFLASKDSIKQYDANLNYVSGIHATDTIYDVMLGPNNLLYACGKGFVSVIAVTPTGCGTCSFSTGLQNNSQKGFSIYPNPSNDNITLQSATELGAISVLNSLGESVFQSKTKNTEEQIDISKLPAGVYIVNIQDKHLRLVKE